MKVLRTAISLALVSCLFSATAYAQGTLLYVTNTNVDNSVSVYSTNADGTLTSVGTIPVGTNPVYLTVRSDQAFAYVSNSNSRTISVINTATQTVGQTVTVAASSDLLGIALSPDGSTAYVSTRASLTQTVRVFSVDNLTGQLTAGATINVAQGPRGLTVSPDGSRLYVVNQTAQSLQVINTGTHAIEATIPVGNQPITVAVNASGTRAYVTNFSGASVSVIDTATNTVIATPSSGGSSPYGIAITPDGNYYYVTTRTDSSVHAFSAATHTQIGTGFSTGSVGGDLMISPDGLSLYAISGGPDNVSMFTIDPITGSLTPKTPATIGTGLDPVGGGVCRYGNSMLATGRQFVANTAGAINCLGSTPTFLGGALRVSGAGLSITQPFALGSGGGTIDTNGNDTTFSGAFSGGNGLTKSGTGTLTLSGANTYTGATAVNGGTLRAGAANTFGANSAVSVAGGAVLSLAGFNQAIGSLTGGGDVTLGSATLTAGANNTTTFFSGVISGTGGLTKTGGGFLILDGANTYTGPTAVTSGILGLNGSLMSSLVTIGGGAQLTGTGQAFGPVVANSGGAVSPGTGGAGSLTVGGLTLNAGSSLAIELTSLASFDFVTVNGTAALGGQLSVSAGFAAAPGTLFPILGSTSSSIVGTFAGLPDNAVFASGGLSYRIKYNLTNVTLTVVATPTLTGAASGSIAFGGTISDTATIAGGSSPTGTITFLAYGPNDATCAGTPAFTTSTTVSGNGAYPSASFTPTAAGTYRWVASYGGDSSNASASGACNDANQSVVVTTANQTITFGALGGKTFGDAPFGVSATGGGSGNAVTFSSTTSGVCTVSTATVTIIAAGICTIAADQAGDGNYNAAPQVTQSFTVAKANQTITFGALGTRILGSAPFTVSATAGSGLSVTFTSQTTSVCTVSGNTVTLVALGTCTIAANQAGNANYNAAAQVTQSFLVAADCSVLSLSPAQLSPAISGLPFTGTVSLVNGASPVTWSSTGALPAGLTFGNGVFSGTATGRGAFPVSVTGTDANGCQATATYNLAVSAERRLHTGTGAGIAGAVRAFNIGSATARLEIAPYGTFNGGVSVAQGDTNGDGVPDLITGAGAGGTPHVQVFDGASGQARLSFLGFDAAFRGGIEVAAGDVTGDGLPDILAVTGCAPTFSVRAFNGVTGAFVRDYPFTPSGWSCGLHVAAGDVNGDGIADVIAGSGGGGAPFVSVIDGSSGALIRELLPYPAGFAGGVHVAAGDVNGDGFADIVTGAGPGGTAHVRAFDGSTGAQISGPLGSFIAYATAFSGGVRVAAGDLNGDGRAEIITAPGPGGGPHVRVWDGATATEIYGLYAFDPSFGGGLFVAGPAAAARMHVDIPAARTTGTNVRVAGWALKEIAADTNGNDAIHVWAYPVNGGAPVFVGAAPSRVARPDIAAAFGGEFLMSGFDFGGTLAAGSYDLVVYARNTRTLRFDQVRVFRVTVN